MKITIRQPLGYSQIGRKNQQEDAVWPLFEDATTDIRCFVLCDGVGGSEHGEMASLTTSKVVGEYLTKTLQEKGFVSENDMQDAVTQAYDALEEIDTAESENEDGTISMATTLTCVCLHKNGVLAAHMGDSRIYHVRPGQGLLYQSADHSLVNALLQAGELTLEEAKSFPRRNIITKAIQPHGKKRFRAEVHQLTDVQSGDYLFLCCDGVLEQLSNEKLIEILSSDIEDKKKLALLEAESTDRTKDNYTAYLIPIDKVKGVSSIQLQEDVEDVVITSVLSTLQQGSPKTVVEQQCRSEATPNKKLFKAIAIIAGFIALSLISCGIILFRQHKQDDVTDTNSEEMEDKQDAEKQGGTLTMYLQHSALSPCRIADFALAFSVPEKPDTALCRDRLFIL